MDAIEFQLNLDEKLIADFENKKFVRPNGEFVCIVLRKDDHLQFEFNASINSVYPVFGDWLVNLDSRRNKYKILYTSEGIKLDRYQWSNADNKYLKKNSYIEYKPVDL